MAEWMRRLAHHYEALRANNPRDPLMIVFDIDGTILDMRHAMLGTLRRWDRENGKMCFADLRLGQIREHENNVEDLLARIGIRNEVREEIVAFFSRNFWTDAAAQEAHRPFRGVLEVIRWFQLQPNTYVGLNTGRPEQLREQTLRTLNQLGREWKVHFESEHLVMNPADWNEEVERGKVRGMRCLQNAGFRIFAFIDNEPENLAAVASADLADDLLLLHADTIFESQHGSLPDAAVSGDVYELSALIPERALPQHVALVWHGVNTSVNLREFLRSKIRWAEVDVRLDPSTGAPVLRRDPFVEENFPEQRPLSLDEILEVAADSDRALKLDLKEGGDLLGATLDAIERHGYEDEQLWFSAEIDTLQEKGFREIRSRRPGAVLQCPIGFLSAVIETLPDQARTVATILAGWGIDRFSIEWGARGLTRTVDTLGRWGFDVNIYDVPDLAAFLRAALLLPRSITSTFDFPHWGYRGRGGGPATKAHTKVGLSLE